MRYIELVSRFSVVSIDSYKIPNFTINCEQQIHSNLMYNSYSKNTRYQDTLCVTSVVDSYK